MGFNNGTGTIFFGANAQKVAEVIKGRTEKTCKGTEYILLTERQQIVAFPKLIKAGYKLAILDD